MPFNTPIDAGQQTILDGGGLKTRDYLAVCPFEIILQCHPAANSAADVLFSFEYDSVVSGDYLDVREDMLILITDGTSTNHYKRPLFRTRVTKVPTSTILFIAESSIALDTSLFVTVVHMYEPGQRLRSGNLIDGHLTFQTLPPGIMGLGCSYFEEPDAITGEASFIFSPTAQAMEEGDGITDATAWEWEFSSAVTYTGGTSSTDREIEVDIPEGHVWVTVKCTSDFGVVGKFIFDIFVQDRYDSDLIFAGNEGVDITNSWDEGVNASVVYFAGVEDLLDRWRITVVSYETFRTGDPEFPRVSFVGYFRNDDNSTAGNETYSVLKSRSYQISGFAALMGESKLSQLAVTDVDPAAAWDNITLPNASRVIHHLRTRYAVGWLQCMDYGTLNDNAWYGGNMDIESPYLLDACNETAEEINAQLIFAADGQIILRRNLNFLDDTARNAADVIAEIPTSRMLVVDYSHPHLPNLAQLQVGFRSYRTADGSSVGLTATAPAIALNEGADFDEAPNQLLTADASIADAKTEARARAGNLLAYRDDGDEFTVELDGAYRFAQPSQHQWWNLIIPASAIMTGIALTSDDRLLLKSVSHKFNPERGTRQLKATFKRETVGGLAMILVEVIPDVVPTVMQPRPPMSAYQGAFAPAGTLNYTDQNPARRPPGNYAYVSMPYSPQQQAGAQEAQGSLGCRVQIPAISFRNGSDVMTEFSLLLGELYYLGVKGFARISDDAWHEHRNLVLSQDSFAIDPDFGAWAGGVGFTPTDAPLGAVFIRSLLVARSITSTTLNRVKITFDLTKGSFSTPSPVAQIFINGGQVASVLPAGITDGSNKTLEWSGSFAGATSIGVQIVTSFQGTAVYSGAATLLSMTVDGTGTNGFTGAPGVPKYGDAFYEWFEGDDEAAELYPASRGLRINSTPVAIPPDYSANHSYVIEYTGGGSPEGVRFQDDDYTDNEAKTLYAVWCGVNAGT